MHLFFETMDYYKTNPTMPLLMQSPQRETLLSQDQGSHAFIHLLDAYNNAQ